MIVGFLGPQGSGKTALQTLFAYLDYQQGARIFANYTLNFGMHECKCHGAHSNISCGHFGQELEKCGSRVGRLRAAHMLEFRGELNNATVCLTEAQTILNARTFMSGRNRIISFWFLQARKRDVNLYYDTQWPNQVDILLRQQTDVFVKLRKIVDGVATVSIFVQSEMEDGLPPRKRVFDVTKAYPLFSTKELIDPFDGLGDEGKIIEKLKRGR